MDNPSYDQEHGETARHSLDAIDPAESILLAAIVASPEARTEIIRLGVGPSILSDLNAMTIASAAMKNPCAAWHETLALPELTEPLSARPNPQGPELGVALRTRIAMLLEDGEVQHAWAVADVRRCTAAIAKRWLPENLDWAAEQLRRGEPYEGVATFIDRWTLLAHPGRGVAA